MQGKIKPLPRDRVLKILQKNGFEVVKGIRGRHIKLRKNVNGRVITTMVSHRPVIEPYVIRKIIKQSDISEEEFY